MQAALRAYGSESLRVSVIGGHHVACWVDQGRLVQNPGLAFAGVKTWRRLCGELRHVIGSGICLLLCSYLLSCHGAQTPQNPSNLAAHLYWLGRSRNGGAYRLLREYWKPFNWAGVSLNARGSSGTSAMLVISGILAG